MGFTGRWLSCYCHYSKRNLYSSNSRALGALMNTLRTQASPVRLKVQQGRAGGFAAGVAADHAAALFPAALAFYLVGGRAILGHAPGHAHPLWPLKSSQSGRPAALAMAFTLRAIWDSDSPNTFSWLPTPWGPS